MFAYHRAIRVTALIIATAVFVICAAAQSNRPDNGSDKKANRRPINIEPSATPPSLVEPSAPTNSAEPAGLDGDIIKINTQLVSIPIRVMDKKGRFIGGLKKDAFKVFEDGQEQEIALFSDETEPFTVALVLDMSYSTTFKVAEIQNAAIAFIDQLRPQDRVMVISFDEEVHMLCEATSDRKEIYRAIKSTKIANGTSLYEALDLVMNDRLRTIAGRKAIILFSDGVDTTSRTSNDRANLSDAMELDSLIYTIRYDTFADVQKMKNGSVVPAPPPINVPTSTTQGGLPFPLPTMGTPGDQGTTPEEYRRAEEYLDELSLRTGGRNYLASTLLNLATAYSKIASELREFYSIGYYPKQDRVSGKRTSIKVKIDQPGLVVKTREGYLVPKKTKITTESH